MNTISTLRYFVRMNWYSRKKKLRARYFFIVSIDPDVSMMQITTALDSGRVSVTMCR